MPQTEKAAQSVARRIAHDIAVRKLPAGATLPVESTMSAAHRVARSTLREALRLLEMQGLIRVKAGRGGGPVVRHIDGKDFGRNSTLHFLVRGATFEKLVEARLALEPVLAGLAAANVTDENAGALRYLVERAERSDAGQQNDAYRTQSAEFHEVIMTMSGNPVLELYASALAAIFQGRVSGAVYPIHARAKVHIAHLEIAESVMAGDAQQAEHRMRVHMEEFVEFWKMQYPGILNEVVDWV